MSASYPYRVPRQLRDFLAGSGVIWLATHERPDADGYGSLLACGLALRAQGRPVFALVDDEVPAHFEALPWHLALPRVDAHTPAPDSLLVFDCHRLDRLGRAAERLPAGVPVAVVDHHPMDDRGCQAEVAWIEPTAAATAVVVLSLLRALPDHVVDPDQATCLYAALVTDTGGFRYENTGEDTFRAAADLVAAGADAAAITETFLHQRRPEALRLLGRVFERVDYHAEGRVAMASIPATLLASSDAAVGETEGIVSHLRSVAGVRLVALGVEQDRARWRVSLRAKPPYVVHDVARRFGGGGHAAAAAFTAEGRWDQLQPRLLDALIEQLGESGD